MSFIGVGFDVAGDRLAIASEDATTRVDHDVIDLLVFLESPEPVITLHVSARPTPEQEQRGLLLVVCPVLLAETVPPPPPEPPPREPHGSRSTGGRVSGLRANQFAARNR